ncbi:MAG TPA: hypothetical protein VFA41_12635 [Ktedonobacteraceae bacterium]|jgi:hypothetical protein|nr:hypothetical protein [Ktedonobacteraceae bacterium]HZS77452.1 hypothetical protein [Ktedonobacteraceae bacterium]
MSQFTPFQPGQSPQPGTTDTQGQPVPPQQPTNFSQMPQAPKQRRRIKKRWIVLSVIVIIIAIAAAAGGSKTPSDSTTTPTTQATQPATQSATQPGTQSQTPKSQPTTKTATYPQFGDGTYVVGKDIQPGTYRTRTGSSGCYFARLKGFGGSVSDIIANENTDAPAIVTIAPSDKGFESTNCGTWTQDLSAITTSKTSFDDGMYIVGTDILLGTYKSSGQTGCYYARLRGFGGTLDDIIANDNTDTSAIVTISASDKGFESTNCGTWTKI